MNDLFISCENNKIWHYNGVNAHLFEALDLEGMYVKYFSVMAKDRRVCAVGYNSQNGRAILATGIRQN